MSSYHSVLDNPSFLILALSLHQVDGLQLCYQGELLMTLDMYCASAMWSSTVIIVALSHWIFKTSLLGNSWLGLILHGKIEMKRNNSGLNNMRLSFLSCSLYHWYNTPLCQRPRVLFHCFILFLTFPLSLSWSWLAAGALAMMIQFHPTESRKKEKGMPSLLDNNY